VNVGRATRGGDEGLVAEMDAIEDAQAEGGRPNVRPTTEVVHEIAHPQRTDTAASYATTLSG
jgi:hypothetical protein